PQSISRRPGARNRTTYRLPEIAEGGPKNLGVDRFLGLEVKIERGRRVAGTGGDRAQRRAFQTLGLEDLARGVQDQLALEVAHRLAPADFPLCCHRDSIYSTVDRKRAARYGRSFMTGPKPAMRWTLKAPRR